MSGNMMSRITSAGLNSATVATAARPVAAVCTVKPSYLRARATSSVMFGSSSTTRTRGPFWFTAAMVAPLPGNLLKEHWGRPERITSQGGGPAKSEELPGRSLPREVGGVPGEAGGGGPREVGGVPGEAGGGGPREVGGVPREVGGGGSPPRGSTRHELWKQHSGRGRRSECGRW